MKQFLLALLVSGSAFGQVVLGDITLTTEEAEDLYTQTRQHSNQERGNSKAVVQITTWLENAKPLANGPGEIAAIDQSINIVRQIGVRRQEADWVDQPTPRTIKQKFIDRAIAEAQAAVTDAQELVDGLTADGAEQQEIDDATTALTTAQATLTAAQAVTIADFEVTP